MGKNIAVLGLGIIGSRAADCLVAAGHQVKTWNRTPKNRADSYPTPDEAVEGADFIALYLKDGNAVREVLCATSREIKHLGSIGSATVVKLATNLISASTVQALSEALALASHHGIDPAVFTESVASNACGSVLANMKLPSMAAGDYDTHFSLENNQ